MKLKAMSIACSLLLGSGAAVAMDYSLGTLTPGSHLVGTGVIDTQSSFEDNWRFSIGTTTSDFLGAIFNAAANGSIGSFSATLSGPNGFSTTWDIDPYPQYGGQGGSFESFGLVAGDYVLHVSGITTAASSYNVAFAAAPVPEPESYAMILAGLGLIGFMARRRVG